MDNQAKTSANQWRKQAQSARAILLERGRLVPVLFGEAGIWWGRAVPTPLYDPSPPFAVHGLFGVGIVADGEDE